MLPRLGTQSHQGSMEAPRLPLGKATSIK